MVHFGIWLRMHKQSERVSYSHKKLPNYQTTKKLKFELRILGLVSMA